MHTTSLGNTVRLLFFTGISLLFYVSGYSYGNSDDRTKLDCGVNALYVLLSLEGNPRTLEQVLDALPEHHSDGYSMSELRSAAGSLGMSLTGFILDPVKDYPKNPSIFLLTDSRGGHFAVMRPVGTTGTMVQILDPPYTPKIVDLTILARNKQWTGKVLMKDGLSRFVFWSIIVSPIVLLIFICYLSNGINALVHKMFRRSSHSAKITNAS
jgi:hypothetical protein